MILPQPSAFKAVLLTLQLFTCPGKFLGEHAFFYKEEGFFELKSSARTTEDLHQCKQDWKFPYKLQLRWILLRGIKQSSKNINRLLFQIAKNPGMCTSFLACTDSKELKFGRPDHWSQIHLHEEFARVLKTSLLMLQQFDLT